MKKNNLYSMIIVLVLALIPVLGTSCTSYEDDFELPALKAAPKYPAEIQQTIDSFYAFCMEAYSDQIPQNIKDDKIEVIRYCDSVIDPSGDVLLEMDGYELIEDILWPNGYGNPVNTK